MSNTVRTQTVGTTVAVAEPIEWAQAAPTAKPTHLGLLSTRTSHLAQRGMVTAEYAVGILAAIAMALVLMRVFNDNEFFKVLLKQVTKLIGEMGKSIK